MLIDHSESALAERYGVNVITGIGELSHVVAKVKFVETLVETGPS